MPPLHSLFVTTSASHVQEIKVKSPAIGLQGNMPSKYTTDGTNVNPLIALSMIPEQTVSMVLLMEDPNAPVDTWVHWLVWNISPTHTIIEEGTVPGLEGLNSFNRHSYYGPCPPQGTRNYYFKVYALNTTLNLPVSATKYEVMRAIKDHVIGYGDLACNYTRKSPITFPCAHVPDIYA